jgi:GR25 family glycosyltransferase involved in LPS biosynthesis
MAASRIPAFVINLDGHEAKFEGVLSRLSGCPNMSGILDGPARFKAVNMLGKMGEFAQRTQDPSAIVSLFAAKTMVMGERRYHCQLTSEGAIGCYLSHYSLWKKCVEMQRPILIMEDDIAFVQGRLAEVLSQVNSMMEDAGDSLQGVVSFDFLNYYSISAKEPVLPVKSGTLQIGNLHRITRPFFATGMYMIHPRAAKALVETAFPIEVQVDAYMGFRADPALCAMLKLAPVHIYGALSPGPGFQRFAYQPNTGYSTIQRNDCPMCEKGLRLTSPTEDPPLNGEERYGSTMQVGQAAGKNCTSTKFIAPFVIAQIAIILLVLFAIYRLRS